MVTITKVNKGSDFDFKCCLPGVEDNDFDAWIYSAQSPMFRFHAGRKGGKTENCEVCADDIVHIFCDNARLGCGMLTLAADIHFPDSRYPDGIRTERSTLQLPIEIVNSGAGSCSGGTISVGDTQLMKRLKEIENLAKNVPSKDDVREMVAEAVASGAVLPFMFYKPHAKQNGKTVLFCRGYNHFFRTTDKPHVGTPVPAEEGYNELVDGQLRASTSRIFRCGRHYYRWDGSQLVDIMLESSQPNYITHKSIHLNAHPGCAYRNFGIPFHSGYTYDLSNYYYEWHEPDDTTGLSEIKKLSTAYVSFNDFESKL